jgi:hypothetical protein
MAPTPFPRLQEGGICITVVTDDDDDDDDDPGAILFRSQCNDASLGFSIVFGSLKWDEFYDSHNAHSDLLLHLLVTLL